MMKKLVVTLILTILGTTPSWSFNPLEPVKTDSPRDTMQTFMTSMQDYRDSMQNNHKRQAYQALDRAVQTLDLEGITPLLRQEAGRESAIFLKEVIDRVIVVDLSKVPSTNGEVDTAENRWRLKNTDITIFKKASGERTGEYLFSQNTVHRAKEFFEKVKDMPYLKGSGQGAFYHEPWLQRHIPEILQESFLELPLWQWLGILFSIFLGFFLKNVAEVAIRASKRLACISQRGKLEATIEQILNPVGLMVASIFWFFTLHVLKLEGLFLRILTIVIQGIFSVAVIWFFYRLTDLWANYLQTVAKHRDIPLDEQLEPLVRKSMRFSVVILGSLIAIQNLGVNIMSVLAGLGLGGLAFALAAKDTAANLFGSLMIFSDRPFKVGDWIKFSDIEGTVESIGFRSTRVRTFYDSQVSIPNAVVANASIDNMGRRQYRRVRVELGVTYDTPPAKLEAFIEGIKNIIVANPVTRKDYIGHVRQ